MKSIYTTDEVLQHICKWLADHYRKDYRCYFYYRFPDNQWSWSQHEYLNDASIHNYLTITAGTTNYSLSVHTDQFKFFTEGKTYEE